MKLIFIYKIKKMLFRKFINIYKSRICLTDYNGFKIFDNNLIINKKILI